MSISFPPKITVVIPVFNGEGHVKNAIDSVIAQTFSNWELLIVDDGSTDSTISIIDEAAQQDRRIKVLLRESVAKGAPVCRNLGIQSAQSGFIIFLDADDLLLPHCLEQRAQKMLDNQGLDFAVFSQQVISDSSTNSNSIFNLPITERKELISSFLSFRYPWQTTGPIWRLDFIKSLGGFDENYHRMEDPDLHLRALISTNKYLCFYDNPVDSVYFVQEKSHMRTDEFYLNISSDTYRFIEKSWSLLHSKSDIFNNTIHVKRLIEDGFFHMLKYYLLARFNITYTNYLKIILFLNSNSILKFTNTLKLKFISMIFSSDLLIVKKLRLRGLVYRLVFI